MLPDLKLRSLPTGKMGPTWGTDGDAVFDDSMGHAVAASLAWHRGRVAADTTGALGSRLHTIDMWTSATPSRIAAYALEALQPLVDAREIQVGASDVTARRDPLSTRIAIEVRYRNRAGQPQVARIGLA